MKKLDELLREIKRKCSKLNEEINGKKKANIIELKPAQPKIKRVAIGVLTGKSATN